MVNNFLFISECVLDVGFVVDGSGSICGNVGGTKTCANWESMKQFIRDVVGKVQISENGTRVAMVTFSDKGHLIWDLST